MTEKVVSLSGGLVLGMVFALFLGIGATQSLAPSLHFEMPSILQMTIAQSTHNTSAPANDTTPSVNVAAPNGEDRGRITRIATLTATTDPAITAPITTTQEEFTPKNWNASTSPKVGNALQRMNLQRSYIAATSQTDTYISLGQAARQSNFAAIAGNSSGREGYGSGQQPSLVDGKPQTHGAPAIAQNDPGDEEGNPHGDGDPAIAGRSVKPNLSPDSFSDTNAGLPDNPERPNHTHIPDLNGGDQSENNRGDSMMCQRNRRRPETD